MAIFTIFFVFLPVFSEVRGRKNIFRKKWLKYILTTSLYIENITKNHTTVFSRNYRGFLHISGTRFIGVFLCFCENPENGPNNMVGGFVFGDEVIKILLDPDHLGHIEPKSSKIGGLRIFSPLAQI